MKLPNLGQAKELKRGDPFPQETLWLLGELSSELSSVEDLGDLQRLLSRKLRWLINFDCCTLAIRLSDPDPTYQIMDLSRPHRLTILQKAIAQSGWVGLSLSTGKPYLIADIKQLPLGLQAPPELGIGIDENTQSLMIFPLRAKGRTIGSLNFSWRFAHGYSQADQNLTALLATQISGYLASLLASQKSQTALAQLHQSEVTLKRSLEFQYRLMESVGSAIFVLDLQGQITIANSTMVQLTGYSQATLLTKTFYELFQSSDATKVRQQFETVALLGMSILDGLASLYPQRGEPIPIHFRLAPLYESGMIASVVGIAQDVSHQQLIEQSLRWRMQQQAIVADLGQQALQGIPLLTLMQNAVALVVAGLGVPYGLILQFLPEQQQFCWLAGVGWQDDWQYPLTVPVNQDFATGFTLLFDQPIVIRDLRVETRFQGSPWLHEEGIISGVSLLIGGQEHPFGVLGIYSRELRNFSDDDIHFVQAISNVLALAIERSQSEEKLDQNQQHLKTILDNSPDIIARLDRSYRHLYVNQAAKLASGFEPDFFLGKTQRELQLDLDMSDENLLQWENLLAKVLTNGEEQVYESDFFTPQGIRHYQSFMVPERDDQDQITSILVISRDTAFSLFT
ncbi:MAG: PAS domain-containing protein [Cyanobacteriota bacterium]|nr:PAS domain-containing protein [Cyanobacteriota bacterium]